MAQTLLQLVNRLRRKLRAGDTNQAQFEAATDPLDAVSVDLLNDAGDYVLGQFEWSFEVRHDGHFRAMPATTIASGLTIYSDAGGDYVATATQDLYEALTNEGRSQACVLRAVFDGLTNEADTAFTITNFGQYTPILNLTDYAILAENTEAVALGVSTGITVCANEYVLPSTVKRVVSVKHQERDVRLEETNGSQIFDRFVRRPHDLIADDPSLVIVGGQRSASEDVGDTGAELDQTYAPSTRGTSLLVYPTPESALVFHYSYVYAYPRLVAASDTWDGIDQMVETAVVELAYAKAMSTDVGKDPEAGIVLENRALQNVRLLHSMDTRMPGYHRTLRSHFASGYCVPEIGTFPRNFGSTS